VPQRFEALYRLLEEATETFADVSERMMFGCDAFFADGTVFALVWKTGRIGVKLPEQPDFERLMAEPGADPWTAGTKTMSQWVLVPERFHEDTAALEEWVVAAHDEALRHPKAKRGGKAS
jgi:TfoX/Sxy family transcriptional regulator of competence genes